MPFYNHSCLSYFCCVASSGDSLKKFIIAICSSFWNPLHICKLNQWFSPCGPQTTGGAVTLSQLEEML